MSILVHNFEIAESDGREIDLGGGVIGGTNGGDGWGGCELELEICYVEAAHGELGQPACYPEQSRGNITDCDVYKVQVKHPTPRSCTP